MKGRRGNQLMFWQKLNAEISQGTPLVRSLKKVGDAIGQKDLKAAVAAATEDICAGSRFSDALAKHSGQFSAPVIAMIRGGENAGMLDDTIERLIKGFENGIFMEPGEEAVAAPLLHSLYLFRELLATGLPILHAISVIAGEFADSPLGKAWQSVGDAVKGGSDLAAAMATHPDTFPEPVVNALRRGEAASDLIGTLAEIIAAVAENDLARLSRTESAPTGDQAGSGQAMIKAVGKLLVDACNGRASDIHFEPQEDGGLLVRFRVDGIMQRHDEFPARMALPMINRLKIMAGMNIAEKRLPQDGRIQMKIGDKPLDLRVSVVPTVHGERITIRILSFDVVQKIRLDMVDLGAEELQEIRRILNGSGIVICSGPAGSGKTTVLYSMIQEINDGRRSLFTVEDPVEYILPGVSQVRLMPHIGLTFPAALRSILRQAPDAIMISEIRDLETLKFAVQAGLTGHLVLTTLHTDSAAASLKRLVDIGMEPFLVGDTVKAITNQRLVRRLCVHCRKPAALPVARLPEGIAEFAQSIKDGRFYEPVGCDTCNGTGYRGRTAVFEVLFMSEVLKKAVCAKADAGQLSEIARAEGMTTILQDGVRKAAAGVTSIAEVMRVAALLA